MSKMELVRGCLGCFSEFQHRQGNCLNCGGEIEWVSKEYWDDQLAAHVELQAMQEEKMVRMNTPEEKLTPQQYKVKSFKEDICRVCRIYDLMIEPGHVPDERDSWGGSDYLLIRELRSPDNLKMILEAI